MECLKTDHNIRLLHRSVICTMMYLGISWTAYTQGEIVFKEVTKETGVTFRHTDGSSEKYYIMETVSAGLALFDYDNDGDIDIYFINGAPLKGTKFKKPPTNALYRNDGNWNFTDVTEQSGSAPPLGISS